MPGSFTVVIADDHALFRQALRIALTHCAKSLTIVGEAENGKQALEVCAAARPEILVLDLRIPKKTTRDVLRELRVVSPLTRTLILTGFADPDDVAVVAREGARAFVLKAGPLELLLEAIQCVGRGELWADPLLSVTVHREFLEIAGGLRSSTTNVLRSLSHREVEVLKHVAAGLQNRAIAASLSISEKTVTSHLNRIFDKLGVSSRLQAALLYGQAARGSESQREAR